VSFASVQALDDVSVRVGAGRATMLVGPNGAGKSTLIKVLLGLVRPDAGRLEVDDRPHPINHAWKSRIGYLPEAVAFSENLSGEQVLRFFARARGIARERVDEVLDQVGLTLASRRRVRGYSRGMRQRLGLGISILSTPDFLILDEPTSGLDQEGLAVLWRVLQDWRDAGRLVLVSSHDLALMERRIDDVCVLRSGRVIAEGSKDQLRDAARLSHRIWFDVAAAKEALISSFIGKIEAWGRGRVDRQGAKLCVEVAAESIFELMEIHRGVSGELRMQRIEEPTFDLVYENLLESDR
jgi:Cu-processing system ATP-binding protein